MLTQAVCSYVKVRRAVGFELRDCARLLHDFARFAAERDDAHVRATTAIEWAAQASSVRQRDRRLKHVIRFARHASAEDAAHQIPPSHVFASPQLRRLPHIYTTLRVR